MHLLYLAWWRLRKRSYLGSNESICIMRAVLPKGGQVVTLVIGRIRKEILDFISSSSFHRFIDMFLAQSSDQFFVGLTCCAISSGVIRVVKSSLVSPPKQCVAAYLSSYTNIQSCAKPSRSSHRYHGKEITLTL